MGDGVGRPSTAGPAYRAFISYSHAVDGKLAPALQGALHRFARPWNRVRALRLFRDQTDLAANPGLWSSIERALADSEFFVLLASPEASSSPWVARETDYWRRRRQMSKLLIVLTDGTLRWDPAARDFGDGTDALPRTLQGAFGEEPLYVDLRWARHEDHLSLNDPRFRDGVASIAATLHGRGKDELVGEDVRQHRRTRRLARSAVATLTGLTLLSGVLAWQAMAARRTAIFERDQATSKQFAALAVADLQRRPDRSLLQSLEAARVADTPEARSALLAGLQRDPRLLAYLPASASVSSVAFGPPDGRVLAVGADDGQVTLLDSSTRATLATLAAGEDVGSVAFSPDGRMLAAGTQAGQVVRWDVADATSPRSLPALDGSGELKSVAFSRDGGTLAAGSGDHTVYLFDLRGRRDRMRLDEHREAVFGVAFSPVDSRRLASAGDDGQIILWDAETGRRVGRPLADGSDLVSGVAFGPDGRTLAAAADGTVAIWDLRGRSVSKLTGHDGVTSVAFSRDGRTIASASQDGTLRMWDARTMRTVGRPLDAGAGQVASIAFHPASGTMAAGNQGGTATLWSVRERLALATPTPIAGAPVNAVAYSPDGTGIALGAGDGSVAVVDAGGRPVRWRHRQPGQPVRAVAFSPDGALLASGAGDGTVVLRSVHDGAPSGQPLRHPGAVNAIAFSPDGRMLAVATYLPDRALGAILIWDHDRRTLEATLTIEPGGGAAASVAFHPRDGRTLAAGDYGGRVALWNLDDRSAPPRTLATVGQLVLDLAFSLDGRALAAGVGDGTVRLWDVSRATTIGEPLAVPADAVQRVAFGPAGPRRDAGRLLAAAGGRGLDGVLTLWDAETRSVLGQPLRAHTRTVRAVAFSPDGRTLASAGDDGTMVLWAVDLASWRRQACGIVGALARAGSARFVPAGVRPGVCEPG